MIQDKIALLMAETGCDQSEAELALEMCGYEVEQAVKAIPRLHKNIVVLKGRFVCPEQSWHGLLLVILNVKARALVRCRAVLSYNPAVCAVPLEKDWFEFEKALYACRLWEGSLPPESLEVEKAVAARCRAGFDDSEEAARPELAAAVRGALRAPVDLKLKRDVLDLGQFQSINDTPVPGKPARRAPGRDEDLILKIGLEEDAGGVAAAELHAGDVVGALIADNRDIGRYLSLLFGGHSEKGPVPVLAPVEAIESSAEGALVRVRFSLGVAGDAILPLEGRYKLHRAAAAGGEESPWWKRFLIGGA